MITHAIVDPDSFDDFRGQILLRKEEERKKKIRMQRPAIMRLLEAHSAEKVQEILNR